MSDYITADDLFILLLLFIAIVIFMKVIAKQSILNAIVSGGRELRRRDNVKDLKKHPRTKSEAYVISILEKITGHKFPTVVPSWLHLELDGYNAELKLALEFSGPLHTKWYPAQEPYQSYYKRVINDEAKKRICWENGVDLIVIDMSLPRHHMHAYLMSRLFDMGRSEMPVNYIPEQIAEPFRNPTLERELGLN